MTERSSKKYSTSRGPRRPSRRNWVSAMLIALAPVSSAGASDDGDSTGHVIVAIRSSAMPSSEGNGEAKQAAFENDDSNAVFRLGELKSVPQPTLTDESGESSPSQARLLKDPPEDLYPSKVVQHQPSVVRVRASDSALRTAERKIDLPPKPIPSDSLSLDRNQNVVGSKSEGSSLMIPSDSSRRTSQVPRLDLAPESFEVGPVEWDNQPDSTSEFHFDSASIHSTLRIPLHSSQSIRFAGKVLRTIPENRTVCRAIVNGLNEVALISRNAGTTRVGVELEDRNGKVKSVIVVVEVTSPWSQSESTIVRDLGIIEQTVREIHQDSQISIVRKKDGSLIVTGTADSEASARSILSMVRRICLVPVKDQIVVRSRN